MQVYVYMYMCVYMRMHTESILHEVVADVLVTAEHVHGAVIAHRRVKVRVAGRGSACFIPQRPPLAALCVNKKKNIRI